MWCLWSFFLPAAAIVKKASESGRTLRDVALEEGVEAALYDAVIDLHRIAQGSAAEADGARPRARARKPAKA